jgi:hypothetical protein
VPVPKTVAEVAGPVVQAVKGAVAIVYALSIVVLSPHQDPVEVVTGQF